MNYVHPAYQPSNYGLVPSPPPCEKTSCVSDRQECDRYRAALIQITHCISSHQAVGWARDALEAADAA